MNPSDRTSNDYLDRRDVKVRSNIGIGGAFLLGAVGIGTLLYAASDKAPATSSISKQSIECAAVGEQNFPVEQPSLTNQALAKSLTETRTQADPCYITALDIVKAANFTDHNDGVLWLNRTITIPQQVVPAQNTSTFERK